MKQKESYDDYHLWFKNGVLLVKVGKSLQELSDTMTKEGQMMINKRHVGDREETAMKGCFPDKARIAREIISYLSAHPDAQDTLDGIVQWWLREQKGDQHTTIAKEVIADLVTQGLIEKIRIEGQTPYYRIRPKHMKT